MADKYITASTLPLFWSVQTNWNGSTFPTSADVVYASGKTITINTNITANTITTAAGAGISAGGVFTVSGGSYTLNTNVSAGTTACLTITALTTSQTTTINGNINGGTLASAHGISKSSGGTLNIIGNISGGSNGTAYGLNNSFNNGAVFITGNAITNNSATAIYHNSTSGLTLVGYIYNSPLVNSVYGINNVTTGTVNVFGNVYTIGTYFASGNHGIFNNSSGFVKIVGDVYGSTTGSNTYGVYNAVANGAVSITGNVLSFGQTSLYNNSTGTINILSPNGILQSTQSNVALITNAAGGTINIIANISGSTSLAPSKGYVVNNVAAGTVNITGDTLVRDIGVGTTNGMINNNAAGTINIRGNIYGGSAPNSIAVSLPAASGVLNISGSVYGGSSLINSPAIYSNAATARINITGSCVAGSAYPAIFAAGTGINTTIVNGSLVYTNGINPIFGASNVAYRIQTAPLSNSPLQLIIMNDTNNNNRYFLTTYTANTSPNQNNVRNGTIYSGFSPSTIEYTGTSFIPPYSSVTLNVPVDNGYGLASGMTINNLSSIISSYIL